MKGHDSILSYFHSHRFTVVVAVSCYTIIGFKRRMYFSVRTLRLTRNLLPGCYVRFYCTQNNAMVSINAIRLQCPQFTSDLGELRLCEPLFQKGLVLGVHCNSKQEYVFTPTAESFNDANKGSLQKLLSM